mmetsp:Transcript_113451/g.327620  ORF Transcript_113451/g.327620 Transcript_113451/m.327620 type:complete len:326 (-) Transcript_113451:39-1016(-)
MASRDGHVGDADIALVAPPDLENLLCQRYHVQAPSRVLLRVPDHVLQNDERRLCPRHLDQWLLLRPVVDVRRVNRLAQFTSQRTIKIRTSRSVGEVEAPADPMAQAPEVHVPNGALALARRNQWVVLAWALEQANPARGRVLGVGTCVDCARLVQFQLRLLPPACRRDELPHSELETAQLHDVSPGETVTTSSELAHHEPQLFGAVRGRRAVHPEGAILLHQAEQRIAARRHGLPVAQHLHLRASAHKDCGLADGKRLAVHVLCLKVEEVVAIPRPCARHHLYGLGDVVRADPRSDRHRWFTWDRTPRLACPPFPAGPAALPNER